MKKQDTRNGEISEADLNAMIAEQLKPENLPIWWYKDFEDVRLEKIGTYTPKPKVKWGRKGRPKNRRH